MKRYCTPEEKRRANAYQPLRAECKRQREQIALDRGSIQRALDALMRKISVTDQASRLLALENMVSDAAFILHAAQAR